MSTTAGFAKVRSEANGVAEVNADTYAEMVDSLRKTFLSGKTRDMKWRRQQLEQIQLMFEENCDAISDALQKDFDGPRFRGVAEVGAHAQATEALASLNAWTKDEKAPIQFIHNTTLMATAHIRKEPVGVVLNIAPWNFPIELALSPVVSCIAAGNCCVIKPSEVSPACAALIESLVKKYLDTDCIKVVQGAVPETTALLKQHWDHILYTGNGSIAKVVLKAAAEHLTPVTLELGGKSPVIVDKTAKLVSVVERVSAAKWVNAGQVCIAPDYMLVHKDIYDKVVKLMVDRVSELYPGVSKDTKLFGKVINKRHTERVAAMVAKTKGTVLCGGNTEADADAHYYPPTIITNCAPDEPLLTEEIFGPVLVILPFDTLPAAISTVHRACSQPLGLYVFSEDKAFVKTVLDNTQSGGVCVNSAAEHYMCNSLPFGGIGASGTGKLHGRHGFDNFSHFRSVLKQDTTINKKTTIPPPKVGEKAYDLFMKLLVKGFVPRSLRPMLRAVVRLLLLLTTAWCLKKLASNP